MNKPFALAATALLLAACTGDRAQPAYDSGDFRAAVPAPEPPRPVEIVALPVPLPLPGQLKPEPSTETAASTLERQPRDNVRNANVGATLEPAADGFVNAMQVYPYAEGALYRLYAAPAQVSDIALQPGERLVSVSAGDTVRWVVGDTTSGEGAGARTHVLVKPIAPGLTTNLVIATDRRAYHLELESTTGTYIAAVSWTYPQDELVALRKRNALAEAAEERTIDAGLSLDALRFGYEISGDDPPWRPLRAFDDGRKVYIQFPLDIARGEAPPLFVLGGGGGAELVNYRVKGSYYIVDRLFEAAELRLGAGAQQVVRIFRSGGTERGS